MKKIFVKSAGIITLGLVLVACSQSPLDALKSDDTNSNYDAAYWQKTAANDPTLFNQALQYCAQNPEKPNCAAVNSVTVTVVNPANTETQPATAVVVNS